MSDMLLKNITLDSARKDILISGGRIDRITDAGLCSGPVCPDGAEVVDCSGKVAVPGFVNMHTHAAMSLMRGIGEDMLFTDWIKKIWKVEENIDREYVYWASKAACLEMIRTGTTTFNDQYWYSDETYRAAIEMGLRPALGYDIMDKGDASEASRQKEQCEKFYEKFGNRNDAGIYEVAFHAIYSVSEEMMLWISDFARRHDLNLHIHLSETRSEVEDCRALHGGLSPVEYLDSLGILNDRVLAAHTLWLSEKDIEILARRGVHCIHNINSNAKISSGYRFLYNELRDAGINICLGTDGCASSNNLDMLEAMKTSAIFQKAWRDDPSAMPLAELMNMATLNGAKALRFDGGVIREGAVADINIVNTDNTFFLSDGDFLANLVYSAHSDCIDSVTAGGRFVMRGREVPGEDKILREARKVLEKLRK